MAGNVKALEVSITCVPTTSAGTRSACACESRVLLPVLRVPSFPILILKASAALAPALPASSPAHSLAASVDEEEHLTLL